MLLPAVMTSTDPSRGPSEFGSDRGSLARLSVASDTGTATDESFLLDVRVCSSSQLTTISKELVGEPEQRGQEESCAQKDDLLILSARCSSRVLEEGPLLIQLRGFCPRS